MPGRVRRAGIAERAVDGGVRDLERDQPVVRAVPAADAGRDRRAARRRLGRIEGDLSAENGVGRVDRHDEPDRAAGGLRSRGDPVEGGQAARWHLSHLRHQDLHHLRRSRVDRQHRAHGAGAAAGCARRHARHLAVRRAEAARQRRRVARRAQRRGVRGARAQARHPRQPDLRDEVRRGRRRDRLSRRPGEPRPQHHVHHDERGAAGGRHPGRGGGRAGDAAGGGLCQGPATGAHSLVEARRDGAHRRARRHPPHAADDEIDDPGGARDLPRHGARDRHLPSWRDRGRAQGGGQQGGAADAHRQGVLDRHRL